MTRFAAGLLLLAMSVWPSIAAGTAEKDILAVLDRQQTAWNRGDLDDFATGYENSPDIIFIGREISRGYEAMKERYRNTYGSKDKMGTLTFSDLEVRMLGADYATVLGRFHLDRNEKGGGPAQGIFTLIFHNTSQGWKIIQDHTH